MLQRRKYPASCLGYPQPPTPMHCNNSTLAGIPYLHHEMTTLLYDENIVLLGTWFSQPRTSASIQALKTLPTIPANIIHMLVIVWCTHTFFTVIICQPFHHYIHIFGKEQGKGFPFVLWGRDACILYPGIEISNIMFCIILHSSQHSWCSHFVVWWCVGWHILWQHILCQSHQQLTPNPKSAVHYVNSPGYAIRIPLTVV